MELPSSPANTITENPSSPTTESELIVSLNYSALTCTTPVLQSSVPPRIRRKRSYDQIHVNRRESRAKNKYQKLEIEYKQLKKSHSELIRQSRQQQTQIKNLKAQLSKTRIKLYEKMNTNRRNLKRVGKLRNVTGRVSDELQRNAQADRIIVQNMTQKLQQLDTEYCELEEKYKEAKEKIEEFLNGTNIPKTKEGNKFTNDIRILYYRLLAEQIPPGKIEKSIKIVVESLFPQIDAKNLQLPKASLGSKMRSCELPTVSKAHQASVLSESDSYHVNSDGTTLNQKKVQGFLVNGMTLGITDVSDGSAKAAVDSLDLQFKVIREVGKELGIKGSEDIGWRLIDSVMSDQASTQKSFNPLGPLINFSRGQGCLNYFRVAVESFAFGV